MPLDRKKNKDLARCYGQDLMRGEHVVGKRTTWVKGDRKNLDDTSRKNLAAGGQGQEQSGTSIFDPVLCELAYAWFCPPGGTVLDPFAGGSVRGIVAAVLGFAYTGIDLSERQVKANRAQASAILKRKSDGPPPKWIAGDSLSLASLFTGQADLVFSCPPYGDLEVYSEDERDLSTKPHADFMIAYREIIRLACAALKPNRFACFVVGDFRDEDGFYRNFVGETIRAFQDAGAVLYNEAILVTAVGSLPIRIGKQFGNNRKLGKTHQNVLVFFKGDPKTIRAEFPKVEVAFPAVAPDPSLSLA